MIAKKAPTTTRNRGKMKEFFHFGFMKGKNKAKKAKHQEAEVEKKSIFSEVLEKPAAAPKTSRNSGRKSFLFLEDGNKKNI